MTTPMNPYTISPTQYDQGSNAWQTVYTGPPPPKLRERKRFGLPAIIATGVVALVLGAGIGDATSAEPAAAPVPGPTVTAAQTVTPEPEEKSPQSCLDALDYADRGFGIAAKVIGYVDDAINAIIDMDVAKMERVTSKINKQAKIMNKVGPKYNRAKTECRGKA